jgi:hypothetical protein
MTAATATPPEAPPAGLGQRWGLFHRVGPRGRWALIVTAGTEALAWDIAHELMRAGSGDWAVRPVGDDPAKGRRSR